MPDTNKPTLKPEELAQALHQFFDWANTDERFRFCSELKDIANNSCPQGTLGQLAFLSEALTWLAEGGVRQADYEWEEAEERMANACSPRINDEREEAKHDRDNARALCRLLLKHQKRAKATFEDIRSQVPIE